MLILPEFAGVGFITISHVFPMAKSENFEIPDFDHFYLISIEKSTKSHQNLEFPKLGFQNRDFVIEKKSFGKKTLIFYFINMFHPQRVQVSLRNSQ